ncbi:MAG: alpha/beta hydrolase [bacterium]|nr:alpha/beta hydrolase [bacterium]
MKHQVLVIHGGDTFKTYEEYLEFLKAWQINPEDIRKQKKDWKDTLNEELGGDFEVILPKMPNKLNAKYLEWKIWLEKFIPYLESEIILIGHSLGGIFLAKYLSESKFPKKILATFLVSAPYDDKDYADSLADFQLPENLNLLSEQGGKIFLFHSQDDPYVPFSDLQKFQKGLNGATSKVFTDRGHFNQEKFPELVETIKSIAVKSSNTAGRQLRLK